MTTRSSARFALVAALLLLTPFGACLSAGFDKPVAQAISLVPATAENGPPAATSLPFLLDGGRIYAQAKFRKTDGGERDALVVLGFAPYSQQSLRLARGGRDAGCRLVALADAPAAPIAEGAEQLLLFEAASGPGFFPSLTGALATAQALAAACFALGGESALARLRATEARLAAFAAYLPDPETSP